MLLGNKASESHRPRWCMYVKIETKLATCSSFDKGTDSNQPIRGLCSTKRKSICVTYIKPADVNIVCCKMTVPLFGLEEGE